MPAQEKPQPTNAAVPKAAEATSHKIAKPNSANPKNPLKINRTEDSQKLSEINGTKKSRFTYEEKKAQKAKSQEIKEKEKALKDKLIEKKKEQDRTLKQKKDAHLARLIAEKGGVKQSLLKKSKGKANKIKVKEQKKAKALLFSSEFF